MPELGSKFRTKCWEIIIIRGVPQSFSRSVKHVAMSSKHWFSTVKDYSILDHQESEHLLCGGCECPVNLMLGPVICIPLLDRMSIQVQFTLGNTGTVSIFIDCGIRPSLNLQQQQHVDVI